VNLVASIPNLEATNLMRLAQHLDMRVEQIESRFRVGVVAEVLDNGGSVASQLAGYAEAHAIDLIVLRSHGRSAIGRLCLGSVGSALVDRAGVPCLLLRDNHAESGSETGARWDLRRILVPLDGSEDAEAGITQALELATPGYTELRLLVVVPRDWVPSGGEEYLVPQTAQLANADAYVRGLARRLESRGHRVRGLTLADDNAAAAIAGCAAAQEASLVSIAAHYREPGERLLFGSVIDTLVHETDIPILARRIGAAARADASETASCTINEPR
jgi:nucleotide-binding universal stress UspA family protein